MALATRSPLTAEVWQPAMTVGFSAAMRSTVAWKRASSTSSSHGLMYRSNVLMPSVQNGSSTSATLRTGVSRLNLSRLILPTTVAGGTPPKLSEADVIDVSSDYADARLGDGLDRLAAALTTPIDSAGQVWIGGTGLGLALDAAARDVSGPDYAEFAKAVTDAVTAKDAPALGRAIGVEV